MTTEELDLDKSKLISVIVPVFNGIEYIEECLESIRAQTHTSIEIIVVDDGSTDGTAEFLQTQADVITLSQANLGPGSARDAAANVASGLWLAFLDSDDMWEREKLTKQIDRAHETGCELIYTNAKPVGDTDGVGAMQHEAGTIPRDVQFYSLLMDNYITLSTVLVSKSAFIDIGGFLDGGVATASNIWEYNEDWDLWLRYLNSGRKTDAIDEALCLYRWHFNSSSSNIVRMHNARMKTVERAFELQMGQQLNDKEKQAAISSVYICSAWYASRQGSIKTVLWSLQGLRNGGNFIDVLSLVFDMLTNKIRSGKIKNSTAK